MPQFIITAKDYTDEQAPQRRMQTRPQHLERMKTEKMKGIFITGGATLNNEGNMTGSVLIIDIASKEAAEQWLENDPYVLQNVWDVVEVTPFRIAIV